MKRSIATVAVCGASLFGFTAVAGAAPGAPSPNADPENTAAACQAVMTNQPILPPSLGVTYLEGVGAAFCPPTAS